MMNWAWTGVSNIISDVRIGQYFDDLFIEAQSILVSRTTLRWKWEASFSNHDCIMMVMTCDVLCLQVPADSPLSLPLHPVHTSSGARPTGRPGLVSLEVNRETLEQFTENDAVYIVAKHNMAQVSYLADWKLNMSRLSTKNHNPREPGSLSNFKSKVFCAIFCQQLYLLPS